MFCFQVVADSTSVTADARFKFKCSRAELVLAADPRKLRAAAPRGWSRSSRRSTNKNRDTYARLDSRRRIIRRTRTKIQAGWIDPARREKVSFFVQGIKLASNGIRDFPTCSAKPSARGYFVRAKSRHSFCVILLIWLCVDLPESRFTSGSRGGSTIASVRTITRVRIHSRRSIGD